MAKRIAIPRSPVSLMEQLDRHAREKPETVAFRFVQSPDLATADLTFHQLRLQARRIALALRRHHSDVNRVMIVLPPGLDYVAAFLGCLYAGAIAVPIYPPRRNRPPDRFLSVAKNSGARFALSSSEIRAQIEASLPEDGSAPALIWLTPEGEDGEVEALPTPYCDLTTPAFLQYTSGSTAEPKGVIVTHANLEHNISLFTEAFAATPDQVSGLSWLPPFHDLGLIGSILSSVFYGVTTVLMSPQAFLADPLLWLRAIAHFKATSSAAPNFAYEICANRATAELAAELDLSSWKNAFNGAEPILVSTLDKFTAAFAASGFRREAFCPCYGLAEATLMVTAQKRGLGPVVTRFDREAFKANRALASETSGAIALVGSGSVLAGETVAIVDPDTRRACAVGEVGEIWVASPSIARGYWSNPIATREHFGARTHPPDALAYLRTGDLGFLHGAQLYVAGRRKDLIIIGGTNHYPQDIELTARQAHPALAEAMGAAFSVLGETGESLVVVHELNLRHRDADFPAVAAAVRAAVSAEHQIALAHCVLVRFAALPKTSSGKIQRGRTRDLFLADALDAYYATGTAGGTLALPTRPAGEMPLPAADFARLVAGVARILELPAPGLDPETPLVQLGMSSLRAVELQGFLEREFSCRLEYEDFFEAWTMRRLAAMIQEKRATSGR